MFYVPREGIDKERDGKQKPIRIETPVELLLFDILLELRRQNSFLGVYPSKPRPAQDSAQTKDEAVPTELKNKKHKHKKKKR